MPPTTADNETTEEKHKYEIVEKDGKLFERSQQDGQLYAKPTVGIIYPPPEVRNIVDRTANFVARNGPEFEDRIRENEAENPKFNFLNPNDPYHAYYQHKSKEYKEGAPHETAPPIKELQKVTLQPKPKQPAPLVIEPIVPKEPPPIFEFTADPPSISAIDLDIVRLTAQFVAKNGKTFLTNLMNREQRNFQFDFLRPQHSLFQYFTRLVEQYTKILLPPSDLNEKLDNDRSDPWKVLDRVKYRVEWQKHQDREKKKVSDEKERERVNFAQIDWHDFVVVETVNFREDEAANLPPPVTKEQLGARLLAQERAEKKKDGDEDEGPTEGEAMDVEIEDDELYQPFVIPEPDEEEEEEKGADSDMEEESDEEEEDETGKQTDSTKQTGDKQEKETEKEKKEENLPPPPLPPLIPGVTAEVRKGYDPKAAKAPAQSFAPVNEKFLISPLTGEKVPAENMAAHMKISLLDPRWKDQNEKLLQEKRHQEQVFAEGVHIGDTLRQLAERRSDIFGAGAEETAIGRKLGEDEEAEAGAGRKRDKEVWDGHSASMERTTKAAHANITLDEQIEAIHRSKGLLPSLDASKIGPTVPKPATNKPFDGSMPPVFISSQPPPHPLVKPPPHPLFKPPQPPQPLMETKIYDLPPMPESGNILPPPPMMPPMPLMSQPPIPPPQAPPGQPPFNQPPPARPPPPTPPISEEEIQPPPKPLIMPPPPSALIQPPPSAAPPLLPPPQMPAMPPPPRPLMPAVPEQPPTLLPSMPVAPPANFVPPQATINFLQLPGMPPPMPPLKTTIEDEPFAKKARLDPSSEADLIPEMEYLKKNARTPITFRVQVPDIPEKSEWNCNGQMLSLCLPLTDQCSVIKSKIYDETQMPAGKQKLQMGNFFLKDSNSLAFYNVSASSVVQLQLKERGGRKK